MLKGLYVLEPQAYDLIYGPEERRDIEKLVRIVAPLQTAPMLAQDRSILRSAEVIFSGWGGPCMDETFVAAAPKLRVVFYGSGSIKNIVSPAFWDRGIRITSAWVANAIPVAEFTVSQILFSLKRGWHFAMAARRDKQWPPHIPVPGAYGSTVGLVSLGMIGRKVVELLKAFEVKVVAYDPFVAPEQADKLGVQLVASLDDLFQQADVVSLHTAWKPETEGMITGRHLEQMKQGAVLINTARGALIREPEMIQVLTRRPDLWAVLDVTYPAPPAPGSPLYELPNVILTPHIAGSMSNECRRMGRYMVSELRRYIQGQPLEYEITREKAARLA